MTESRGDKIKFNNHWLKPVDYKATESRAQAESQMSMTESPFRLEASFHNRLKVRLEDC